MLYLFIVFLIIIIVIMISQYIILKSHPHTPKTDGSQRKL